jgi:hypothetical protein
MCFQDLFSSLAASYLHVHLEGNCRYAVENMKMWEFCPAFWFSPYSAPNLICDLSLLAF